MKFHLSEAIFINKAPFDKLHLIFQENEISVLSGVNGKGKTTILSHIVDSFYELAKIAYQDVSQDGSYYRISSALHNLERTSPSYVYLRFKTDKGENNHFDFIFIVGKPSQQDYDNAIALDDKIPYSRFQNTLSQLNHCKIFSKEVNKKYVEDLFRNNISIFFPSYRFENPGYLNDSNKAEVNFTKESLFSGRLNKPLEVVTGMEKVVNWFLDVVLDIQYGSQNLILKSNIDSVVTKALSGKFSNNLSIGVGQRNLRGARVNIVDMNTRASLYPTLFNLSSGESALISTFSEILRQADMNQVNISLSNITGIVLVDEITKHLHIKLQKEVLPALLDLFPNVQFITSSHSPFLNLGLAHHSSRRSKIIDIDSGLAIHPVEDSQYNEVYQMMISENQRFKDMYQDLNTQINTASELQIVTEGKNTEHINKAIEILSSELHKRINLVTGAENRSGDQQLKNAYEIMKNAENNGTFLFVWDCDSSRIPNSLEENDSFYNFSFNLNKGNKKTSKGIENLYSDSLFTEEMYDIETKSTTYGGETTTKKFNKNRFVNKIKGITNPEEFSNFQPLIDKINSIINTAGTNERNNNEQEDSSLGN